jgi:putative flavoprotein involved in K+ transport
VAEHIDDRDRSRASGAFATSYHLTRRSREHVVLERGQVANTWRTQRWDGFYLNTPRWTQQLPGHAYRGPEPDAFSSLQEAISHLDEYAASFAAPIRTDVVVSALRSVTDGLVEADGTCYTQTTSSSRRAHTGGPRRLI